MLKFVYNSELITSPIIYGIKNNLISHQIKLIQLQENEIYDALENREATIGIISPLEYAKARGNLYIVKDFIISSADNAKNALLFFKYNLSGINQIYFMCDYLDNYDCFFGELVMREIFNIQANWIIIEKNWKIDVLLKKYDVIFLSGEKAFDVFADYDNYIDLSEEWILNTKIPLIHRILVVHKSFKNREVLDTVRLSRELGLRNLMKIAKDYAQKHQQNWDIYYDVIKSSYQYFPDFLCWSSLENILQYIFYYGKSEYYPDLKFYEG